MRFVFTSAVGFFGLLAAGLIASAAEPKSLVPVFGATGKEHMIKAKDGHKISGWLPNDWVDNSEWAAVTAVYSKLGDAPAADVGAVRIRVVKVDDGQLQLTSWAGKLKFKAGAKQVVEGWVRSKERAELKVGIRQPGDPYEFFVEQDLSTTPEWKRFSLSVSFGEEREGVVMFTKADVGTVDLAGVVVLETK